LNLKLTLGCGPYDRIDALARREIAIEGVDLQVETIQSPRELFDRVGRGEFQLAELSVSEFISETCGQGSRFVGLPVFPSKVFRHGFITINTGAGIESPRDLAGRRIGLPLYTQTAAIWARGLLEDEYGVDLSEVRWVQGAVEQPGSHGDAHPPALLKPVRLENNESGRSLNDLLVSGEIDALLGARLPPSLGEDPRVARLFPDFREREKDYFRRTRIHPIMHLVALERSLHEAHPWLAPRLYRAFVAAKEKAWSDLSFSGAQKTMLPWLYADITEVRDVFGADPWPYGVEANHATLTTLVAYMHQQNFIPRRPGLEELFVSV
jgi:4,5-dihydroxyphthalate decarboxylase